MSPSIRTYLLINLLLSVTLITSLAIIGNLFIEHRDLQSHLDSQLSMVGLVVQSFVDEGIDATKAPLIQERINSLPTTTLKYVDKQHRAYIEPVYKNIHFQVTDASGKIILHSLGAPLKNLIDQQTGFTDEWFENQPWRIFVSKNPSTGMTVYVAEKYNFREQLEGKIAQDSIFIMLLTYPFLGLLIWIIVGSGLDSIKRVADEISHRAPTHLNPVDIKAIPKEIQPLIDELNRLFSELHEAFEREKRFAADAAHELKTPLAALRAQTQVAMRAHSDGQRLEALQKLITGVDRSAHVVQQLLTMSRMVPEATLPDFSQVNLRKIAAEVIAEIAPKALEKNTEIELVIPKFKPLIKGSPMALNILIRNLIDNAVRYTPYGSKIQVSLLSYRNKTQLIVADDGPGIPEELRQRVFERFFRVIGNRAQGSGLGLGIVKQIADLHHATVQLDVPEWGKGLEVVISFPS